MRASIFRRLAYHRVPAVAVVGPTFRSGARNYAVSLSWTDEQVGRQGMTAIAVVGPTFRSGARNYAVSLSWTDVRVGLTEWPALPS